MKNTSVHRMPDARSAMTDPPAQAHVRHRSIAGFTLTELMVVISIIVILVTAAALTSLQMLSSGAGQHTRIILAAAKSIAEEYQLHTGVIINHDLFGTLPGTPPGSTYNWTLPSYAHNAGTGTSNLSYFDIGVYPHFLAERLESVNSERFVWVVNQLPATRDMLMKLGKEVFIDDDQNGFLELRDGWGRKIIYVAFVNYSDTYLDDNWLPEHPRPYFASVGRDGLWETADDLYSFDID